MLEVGTEEAGTNLSRLLERVEASEEVVITRSGKPVARLLPAADAVDAARVREAVAGIRAMRRSATFEGLEIKDLVSEGRR